MLRSTSLLGIILFASVCPADNVTFLRIDRAVVQQRATGAPQTPEHRVQILVGLFEKAGCSKDKIEVQKVPDQPLPNVLCTLPGTDYGAILVATRIDYDGRGDEGAVGWGDIVMLPLLVESLTSTVHRHTLIFAAFSGTNNAGIARYWKSLTDAQRREFRGGVDLDHLGRTAAGYSTLPNGAAMARMLPAAARALRMSPEPQAGAEVPESNSAFLARVHIPAITIYSAGYISKEGEAGPVSAKVNPLLPADVHQPPPSTPHSFALRTALDPSVYNDTYNLLCVYLLFLDRGLGASKHAPPEVQMAKSALPQQPKPTESSGGPETSVAAPPSTSLAPSAPSTPAASVVARAAIPTGAPAPAPNIGSAPDISEAATIRVNTRLVQFDVVVTDNQGRPVKDLTAADFTVLQDGQQQTVRAFEAHSAAALEETASLSGGTAKPVSATLPPNSYSNVPAKAPQTSWTIVLFDLLNTAVSDQAYARNQLLKLLKSVPRGEPVALFVLTRQLEMLQGFTQDPNQLVHMAEMLDPARSQLLTTMAERERTVSSVAATAQQAAGAPVAPTGPIDTSTMVYAQTARILQSYNDYEAFRTTDRVIFTLEAMRGLARAVSGYPGRKNMVWLSGSFPVQIEPDPASTDPFRNERGFENQIRATSSLLATSRVAVYPVDVRGLQSQGFDIAASASQTQVMTNIAPEGVHGVVGSSPSVLGANIAAESAALSNDRATMKTIAEQTGGEAFVNTNDLSRVIARSLEDGSTYYTLAYTPPKSDESGGYHRVVVKVPGRNLKLAYRRGYYSIPQSSTGAVGTAALRAALQPGMPPATSMLLTASIEPPDASRRDVKVNYVIDSNGIDFSDAADNKKRAQVDCMVIAFDSSGKEVAHASDTLDATIPATAYAAVMTYGLPAHQLIGLPPGKYNLKIGVMDRTTQQIGTVDAPLEVPATAVAQR
jgi:VWFA-related protein